MRDTCICSAKQTTFIPFFNFEHTPFPVYRDIIIGRCKKCGVLKTTHRSKTFDPASSRDEMYEENAADFKQLFLPFVKKLKKYLPDRARVLDVGCSSGVLLELFDKVGFEVYGLEPNKHAFHVASKKFGGRVFNMTLEEFVKKDKTATFDCVLYNHVLEHIKNPAKELQLAYSALNEHGILFIGVPNRSNVIFHMRKQFWESLMPGEHVWHFSDRDVVDLLQKAGFVVLESWYDNHVRADYPIMKRMYFGLLCFLNTVFHTGEAVTIIARKLS